MAATGKTYINEVGGGGGGGGGGGARNISSSSDFKGTHHPTPLSHPRVTTISTEETMNI